MRRRYQEGGAAQLDPTRTAAMRRAVERAMEFQGIEPAGGIPIATGQSLAEMQQLVGQSFIQRMHAMRGTSTDRAVVQMQGLNQQMGRNVEVNERLLEMMRDLERRESAPMDNSMLGARLRAGEDPADLEAEQIERSYNTTGTGGRIETHANGALEWVPNGPGDVPQPPVGDVFYDPIEQIRREQQMEQDFGNMPIEYMAPGDFEQKFDRLLERMREYGIVEPPRGFAKGGAVKKYQAGGDVVAEEEEVAPAPAVDPQEIVERTTDPREGQSLTSMILMNRQSAIDRLRATRQNLASRRDDAREQERRDRWLAFGQAMLSPTRTGAFGESLGIAAGTLREERARSAQAEAAFAAQDEALALQEIDQENKAIEFMLESAGQSTTGKDIHGAIQTMVAPEDRNKPVEQQRIIFGVYQKDPVTGEWGMNALRDPNENYFLAADRLDPARAAALMEATQRARMEEERSQNMIETAYGSSSSLSAVRRANQLFEQADPNTLDTSGIQRIKQRAAEFLGVDFGDTVDLAELQNLIAEDYINKLAALKGSSSDRDVIEMQAISAGLGRNTTANYRTLKRMEAIYERQLRRGIRQAMETGDQNAVRDLWASVSGAPFDSTIPIFEGGISQAQYDALDGGARFYIIDPDNIDTYGQLAYVKPLLDPEAEAEE